MPRYGLFCLATVLYAANCERPSTGFFPLDDPFFDRPYRGMEGGLYPGGASVPPSAHFAAGLRLAAEVRPRNSAGAADDAAGRIVLVSIGMSNTTQEFSTFKPLADRDPEKNPQLLIVDGAQGGWSADRLVAGGQEYWNTLDQRLRAAGASAQQVQAAWMKQADAGPTLSFPEDARKLQAELAMLARTLRERFPNLRLLYLSSRTYAGYASTNLNPEPYAYQSGFAVKWLIEAQISGDADLSYQAGRVPWMAWGPYMWVDGTQPRDDGLTWECADFQEDGTHPSPSGRQKVAVMLLQFFKGDPTARPWFVRRGPPPARAPAIAAIVNAASYQPAMAMGSIVTLFGSDFAASALSAPWLPLPVSLGGTSVLAGGRPAVLYYVSPAQINLVLPKATASTEIVVRRETLESNALKFEPAFEAPGLFGALHDDGRLIRADDPARRGEIIQIFYTGASIRHPLSRRPDFLPVVRIGGAVAEFHYSGPAPFFPGLHQINARIPPDAPVGAAVPLIVELASATSNSTPIAVRQ